MDINATNALTLYKKKLRKEVEGKKYIERLFRNKRGAIENLSTVDEKTHNKALDDVLALIDKA